MRSNAPVLDDTNLKRLIPEKLNTREKMEVGDAVRVKFEHHNRPGWIGVILEDFARSTMNKGKAFRIIFTDGKVRTLMAKNLEVINGSR